MRKWGGWARLTAAQRLTPTPSTHIQTPPSFLRQLPTLSAQHPSHATPFSGLPPFPTPPSFTFRVSLGVAHEASEVNLSRHADLLEVHVPRPPNISGVGFHYLSEYNALHSSAPLCAPACAVFSLPTTVCPNSQPSTPPHFYSTPSAHGWPLGSTSNYHTQLVLAALPCSFRLGVVLPSSTDDLSCARTTPHRPTQSPSHGQKGL